MVFGKADVERGARWVLLGVLCVGSLVACTPRPETAVYTTFPVDRNESRSEGCPGERPPGVAVFAEGMKRPEPATGPSLTLTPEAAAVRAEGRIRVWCIVTTQGEATDCVVVETIPYMTDVALQALAKQRFQPAEQDGEPIAVDYEFRWDIRWPDAPPPASPRGTESTPPTFKSLPKDKITRPRHVSGPQIRYTPLALCNRVDGIMKVQCVMTEEGRLQECRVLQTVPYMEQAVLRVLEASRYTPVILDGRPARVRYTFTIRLVMPKEQ
ncbi:energy transducer TonB [Polyangium sp. 6x1]|uniref:energy transducer TonB n=1 Tax=Polyangium sp. 6x1 TaxID=3042689 RepID=UPI00248247CD|nr:energy transducer TonB [Polyangium sp. 6x1]MDI1448738.1 energy transducer TonB [Polyangium sp. 6x1]